MRLPRAFGFVIRYLAPAYLLVIVVGFSVQELPGYVQGLLKNPTARNTLLDIGAFVVFLLAAVRVAERRWRAQGLDLNGTRGDTQP